MNQLKIRIYLPIADVQREFGATKKTFSMSANFEPFEVKLRKRGDSTLVEVTKGDPTSDLFEAEIDIKSRFSQYLVDRGSIARVQAILDINPEDELMQDIMSELRAGEPLGGGAEGILSEREWNIENLNEEIEAEIEEARSKRPNFRLLESFERQFRSGRELSERQLEIIRDVLKPAINPEHLRKVNEAIALKPRSTFFKKLKAQVEESGSLSPKQLAVVESALSEEVVVNQSDLQKVEEAIASQPRSTFLKKLKAQVQAGSSLSAKQRAVVEEMIGETAKPQFGLLQDLLANGSGLSRDDRDIIFRGVKDIDSLSEDERKRVRHLIYKNTRRLHGTYTRDFIQETLKKASMRLASRYLRNNIR